MTPRNVRPFWITAEAEGREVAIGPKRRDGRLDAFVSIRKNGYMWEAMRIYGRTYGPTDTEEAVLEVIFPAEAFPTVVTKDSGNVVVTIRTKQ